MTRRYQRIAITLYLSVFLAILLFILVEQLNLLPEEFIGISRPRASLIPIWIPLSLTTLCTTVLVILERRLDNQSLSDLPRDQGLRGLGLRFVLVAAMIILGQAPFVVYMLYPVLLFTFFTFGRQIAYVFAGGSSLFVVVYVLTFSPVPAFAPPNMNNLLIYLLGLLMVMLMANVLLDERETNQQLQAAHDHLGDSHTKLQAYSAQVATMAATDERNRLARDIHDSLGHHLTASSIQLEKASLYLDRDLSRAASAINHAQRTIRQALSDVRSSVQALREQDAKFELVSALNDLIGRMRHHELAIRFNLEGDEADYSTFVKMTIYRIVQEGLTNIHKHAEATEAIVELTFSDQEAVIKICDNGRGFDQRALSQGSFSINGRYGLQGVQERVALVGGRYSIKSKLGEGTILSVTAPRHNSMVE